MTPILIVTGSSGHRPCKRGVKSSLRREPQMRGDLLRALFGIHPVIEDRLKDEGKGSICLSVEMRDWRANPLRLGGRRSW
jgi:hypothetical protein